MGAEEGRGTPTALCGVLITRGRGDGNVRPNTSDDRRHQYLLAGPKGVGPCFQRRNLEIRVGHRDHLQDYAPPREMDENSKNQKSDCRTGGRNRTFNHTYMAHSPDFRISSLLHV